MRTLLRLRQLASASAAFSAAAAAVTTVAAECGASAPEEEPVRVPLATLQAEFLRVLRSERVGLAPEVAALCAKLFTENQRDGVYSHGLNRFGGFVSAVASGNFDRNARPTTEMQLGCVEQWDGHCGIGLWNANAAMSRAVELARVNGIGCVALRNTNHWMRAGSYGLQAARAGCVGICWTNTCPLMPPWGSAEAKIGNNPLCIAIPRGDSQEPLLLDMAMSQYSNGKLQVLSRAGRELPLAGGFDADGALTTDPAAILASRRALPVGYWKGSGLAVMLDVLAAALSHGDSTVKIGERGGETNVSQVFIAVDLVALSRAGGGAGDTAAKRERELWATIEGVVADIQAAEPLAGGAVVRCPGEGTVMTRRENQKLGAPVDKGLWDAVKAM